MPALTKILAGRVLAPINKEREEAWVFELDIKQAT
jgi:hypothetical protein